MYKKLLYSFPRQGSLLFDWTYIELGVNNNVVLTRIFVNRYVIYNLSGKKYIVV